MPPTPSQIREQLLKAIDQDAKVINMVCVLEAISCLENTQITKEALEETRLGKIVNDIRKNTDDSSLAARCKKLVRVWSNQFVRGASGSSKPSGSSTQDASANRQPTPPTQGTTSSTPTGGHRTPLLKAQTSTTPSPTSTVDKKKSENRKRRKLSSSPSTGTPTGSAVTSAKKPRPGATTPTSNATKDQSNQETKNGMPAQTDASKSSLQSSKSAFSKVKPSGSQPPSRTSSPALKAKGTSSPSLSKLNTHTSKAVSKSPSTKQVSSPVNSGNIKCSPVVSSASKAAKLSPSVKVKQLSDSNSTDSSRLKADVTVGEGADETRRDKLISSRPRDKSPNTLKSLQDSNSSSATVKLRSPSVCVGEQCTAPAKASCSTTVINYDYTQPVLQSIEPVDTQGQDSSRPFSIFDDDYEEDNDYHSDEKHIETSLDFDKGPAQESLTLRTDWDEPSGGGLLDTALVDRDVEADGPDGGTDVHGVYPDQHEVLSDVEEDHVPPKPVTAEDIARIHEQQWENVNGCYNNQREWFDWTQPLSVTVQDDNALHILPYVCLD